MAYGKALAGIIREGKSTSLYTDPKNKSIYLNHHEGKLRFQVRFREFGNVGVDLESIAVSSTEEAADMAAGRKRLSGQTEQIQRSITFLPEKLRLLEIDHTVKRAQLRSYPPQAEADAKYYYEIVLEEGNSAHFQRYQYARGEKCYRKVNSQLTRDSFEKLVDAFAELF